jgi:hypothetical protein
MFVLCALFIFPLAASADVPNTINYQGFLTDPAGNPLNSAVNLLFKIYGAAEGGTALWQENHVNIAIFDGVFNVVLGQTVPFPQNLFDASGSLYLGVTVDSDSEMTPRQVLTSVPFAIRAAVAQTAMALPTGTINSTMLSDYAVTGAKIDFDSITSDKIAAGAIYNSDISSGAVSSDKIAIDSINGEKILNGSITYLDIQDGSGSLLNADLLDGNDESKFFRLDQAETVIYTPTFSSIDTPFNVFSNSRIVNLNADFLDGVDSGGFAKRDGTAQYNLNADMLDGYDSTHFLRPDALGNITVTANYAALYVTNNDTGEGAYGIRATSQSTSGSAILGQSNGTSGKGVYAIGNWGVYGHGVERGVVGYGATYDFYATGMGNYGPFTGAHEVMLASNFPQNVKSGMVVSVTGEVQARKDKDSSISISSTLPTIKLSDVPNDKKVFGALVKESPLSGDHWCNPKGWQRFGIVNALGEGRVWVSNANGDINAGDYITTSSIPGYGQLQKDDLLHSYTLGKATESVDWSAVTDTIEHNGSTCKIYLIAVV